MRRNVQVELWNPDGLAESLPGAAFLPFHTDSLAISEPGDQHSFPAREGHAAACNNESSSCSLSMCCLPLLSTLCMGRECLAGAN